MPKTNHAIAKNYKACPFAEVHEYDGNYWEASCCSSLNPKRGHYQRSSAQTRICCGGTSNGKRYTSCPYYKKGTKSAQAGVKVHVSGRNILASLLFMIVCLCVGGACIKGWGGEFYMILLGLGFIGVGVWIFVATFRPSGQVQHRKSKKKR